MNIQILVLNNPWLRALHRRYPERGIMTNAYLSDLPPQPTSDDCYGFARWAGYIWKKALIAPTTKVGGREMYRQSHVLFTGGLPSEVQ